MKIYNSLTRKKEVFKPLKKGQAGIYVCGPTVYDEPHIGHARAAYIFAVVRNYLEYKGYKVRFVKNITDVDDKIITRAKEDLPDMQIDRAVREIAQKYTRRYYEDMQALGIRRASFAPKATEHIQDIQDYISRLVEKKFAYESNGSVYFDVRRFGDYGKLSRQNPDQMRSALRTEKDEGKKNILDFVLWKKAKEGEPCWDSPWGKGRPGWHIECSVMASIYLGDEFDIHAGGQDLIFPHHENEIAQSRSFSGKGFARVWMHNGLLTINRQKMAKSLGNFVSVKEFLKHNIPDVLKLFFLSAHYRNPVDYNEERIQEARKTYERFQIFFDRMKRRLSKKKTALRRSKPDKKILRFKEQFEKAMDDDFNTPQALARLFDLVNFGNKLLLDYKNEYRATLQSAQTMFADCNRIFGVDFARVSRRGIPEEVKVADLIETREHLRKKGNFAEADKIRKQLAEKGIILEDTKQGTLWRRKI